MTKQEANRKLEKGVMRSDAFLVSVAFSEGASIGYKNGAFFGTACRLGNLEIVEMFVLDYRFVQKANYYQKNYSNPSFHEGMTYAIANGKLDVVKFLNESPIYRKLKKLDEFIFNGIEFAIKNKHIDVVDYIFRNTGVLNTQLFKDKHFTEDIQNIIDPIVSFIKLEKSTRITGDEKTTPEKMKMKI